MELIPCFSQTIIVQQNTTVSINIWPRIFYLEKYKVKTKVFRNLGSSRSGFLKLLKTSERKAKKLPINLLSRR